MKNIRVLLLGILFGIILTKSEVVSWFRIQEMFRFQSFHMYGIIGSAVVVAAVSLLLIKRFKVKTIDGEPVVIPKKPFTKGHIIGGTLFGVGWAFTGACPGPLYALVGSGLLVFVVAILAALLGVWVYGVLKERLPH